MSQEEILKQYDALMHDLDQENITLLELKQKLRVLLVATNKLDLSTIGSTEELKQSFNRVFEAFLTSDYADNKEERTNAVLLMNHLKTVF